MLAYKCAIGDHDDCDGLHCECECHDDDDSISFRHTNNTTDSLGELTKTPEGYNGTL